MKNLIILGAGTAGTMMANHLNRKLDRKNWKITVVDEHKAHYYQPGFLFVPFGIYSEKDVVKEKQSFIPKNCDMVFSAVETIQAENSQLALTNGQTLNYDILIVATGSKIVPDEVEGLLGDGWRRNIFDFYTLEGATALRDSLLDFKGGKLVVNVTEMPIKCPVAPLEFVFLADWWLSKRGLRQDTELTYVTPLSDAFTKKKTAEVLGRLLEEKNINLVTDFDLEQVDGEKNRLVAYDERSVDYDLLATIPTNMGDDVIERSGMGDDLNFIPTDKHTLQSKNYENIFVIGDATDLPSSKAGSVAHFQADVLTENILHTIAKKPLLPDFDGHANCFIESGYKKGFLIDFNYNVEPVPGKFPFPVIGPMALLKESYLNHIGKMAFKWIYWYVLLKGLPMPGIPAQMSTAGKKLDLKPQLMEG